MKQKICFEAVIIRKGVPEFIHSYNRSESITKNSKEVFVGCWIQDLLYRNGKFLQNGFTENFNGRFRGKCLNRGFL